MKPGSQVKCTLFGNTVESPEEEPFKGADKGPQSTARMFLIKQALQSGSELNVSALSANFDFSGKWYSSCMHATNNHKHIRLHAWRQNAT